MKPSLTEDEKRLYDYLLKQPNDNGVLYLDIFDAVLAISKPSGVVLKLLCELEGKAIINQSSDFKRTDDDFSWITILEKVNYNPKTKSPIEYFQAIKKIPNDVLEDLIYTLNEGA